MCEEVIHYTSLRQYARIKGMDWRTAKSRYEAGLLICFIFRGKKVYIERDDVFNLALRLLTKKNDN